MWTKDHKTSDANHITWINLIQSNTTHCAKLGLMRVQKSYIVASSAQVTAPFGGFSFRGLKTLKGGGSSSTPEPRGKNTVKRNSKRESSRKSSKNRRLFTGANLVVRPALLRRSQDKFLRQKSNDIFWRAFFSRSILSNQVIS